MESSGITRSEPEPEPERTIVSTPTSSVHSPASSPSHEFSFTISLHSTNTTTSATAAATTRTTPSSPSLLSKPKHRQTPSAIDLTPADDIFFHGHLLPLHFLSHLHATSPRSSTTSLDSFTLPATQPKPILKPAIHSFPQERPKSSHRSDKSKSFSLSALAKWIKGSETKEKSKKAAKFDVTQFVKRYIKIIKPLLSPRGTGAGGGADKSRYQENQTYSFSGSLSPRLTKRDLRSLRGELSAPASMRTSPTNSGRLLPNVNVQSAVSESTMEELQSAIQAAIAHCKNSTNSVQDKSTTSSPVPVN